MKKYLILLIIAALFSGTSVSAVGVRHGDTTIYFQPNLETSIPFAIGHVKDGTDVELSVIGGLKDYVALSNLSASGEFTATVRLPDKIEKPGTHTILIRVAEIPSASAGTIAAVTAVQIPVVIKVPYPRKYIEIKLDASDVRVGVPVIFVISVTNLGEQDIASAKGAIEIYNPSNEKIAAVYTEGKSIETTATEELYTPWKTEGVKGGEYRAIATVNADGETAETEKSFKIGTLLIKIVGHAKKFQKDTINPFNIELESGWNDEISDVYAEIVISDENKNQVWGALKTPSMDIAPWGRETLTAYWNTEGIDIGSYDAKITLHYSGKTTEKVVTVEVVEEPEVVGKLEIVEEPEVVGKLEIVEEPEVVEERRDVKLPLVVPIYIITAICIVLVSYWYLKKKRGGDEDIVP